MPDRGLPKAAQVLLFDSEKNRAPRMVIRVKRSVRLFLEFEVT